MRTESYSETVVMRAEKADSASAPPQLCQCYLCATLRKKHKTTGQPDNASIAWRLRDFEGPFDQALKAAAKTCDGWAVWAQILDFIFPQGCTDIENLYFEPQYVHAFGEAEHIRLRFGMNFGQWIHERKPYEMWELFTLPGEIDDSGWQNMMLNDCVGQTTPWPDIVPSNMLAGSTNSDASFETARGWLKDCDTNHKACHPAIGQETVLPPRLIDVGSFNSGDMIKILETTDMQFDKYVSLSHCWGSMAMPLKCTERNLAILKAGFKLSELPRTFQDAVDFTRRLEIRWLWIDSLCILQDNYDDWQRHTRIMTDVYQNAYLTLAAAWGKDGSTGMYRDTTEYEAQELKQDTKSGDRYSIYCRKVIPHWWSPTAFSNHDQIIYTFEEELPMLDRAWCYQERLLSRRVLHFSHAELQWECKEQYACECTQNIRVHRAHRKAKHAQVLDQGSATAIAVRWREIVTEYSSLGITYDSDRLPALLGIAKGMQMVTKSRILAGSWEDSLFNDLLWSSHLVRAQTPYARNPDALYPTWSWLSARTKVYYNREIVITEGDDAAIVRVDVDTSRFINELTTWWASLTLRARVIPGTLKTVQINEESARRELKFVPLLKGSEDESVRWDLSPDYSWKLDGPGQLKDGASIYYAWMAVLKLRQTHSSGEMAVDYGLLLRCLDEEKNIYERVGCSKMLLESNVGSRIRTNGLWKTVTLI